MSDTATLLLALSASLVEAATYNKSDQVQPAAVLWPDKERQWEPLLPILRQQVPLLTMGAHDPTTRTGPAYYLRCMIAGTLEDRLPADAVAILTTDTLDATTIDHATVVFEGATETHVNKKTGEPTRHVEDVDGDGDMDLVLHFRLGDTRLTCASNEAMLVGQTFDGKPITGADYVRMVGNK